MNKRLVTALSGLALAGFLSACTQVQFQTQPADGSAGQTPAGGCTSNCTNPTPGQTVTESLVVPVGPKVDILFVVDNSPSMTRELQNLGSKFPDFINSLTNVNWRIGITTTDTSGSGENGSLLSLTGYHASGKVLVPQDSNGQAIDVAILANNFQSTIQIDNTPDSGALGARGIYASVLAVQKNDGGLIRSSTDTAQDAKLDVIYISDEDNLGNGTESLDYQNDPSKDTYDAVYSAVKASYSQFKADNMRLHSFIIKPGDTYCYGREYDGNDLGFAGYLGTRIGHYGVQYASVVSSSKGINNSICDDNFTPALQNIGAAIGQQIFPNPYTLKCTPKDGTMAVIFTPAGNAVGVHTSGATLVFDSTPAAGTQVGLSYTCASTNTGR